MPTSANAPTLRPIIRLEINVAPPTMLGELDGCERRIVSILGGAMTGPDFTGKILAGGNDVQTVRADGTIKLVARFAVDLGPAGKLLIENTGIRRGAAPVEGASNPPYFRGVISFSAPAGPLQWLNQSIFVTTGRREGATVYLDVLELL